MTLLHLGPDPVQAEVADVLAHLDQGLPPNRIETRHVDVKEERGRRKPDGSVGPGRPRNEAAANQLTEEMACFANTAGGGAIILGVADDGTPIGTELDGEWLRHRIWQLSGEKITCAVQEHSLGTTRLLVLTTVEAIEPVPYKHKIKWRVGSNCVEVDASTWHSDAMQRRGVDWSAQPSGHTLDDVDPSAVEVARQYLRQKDRRRRDLGAPDDLADAHMHDLLDRLGLTNPEGRLTNAGSLMFVGTPRVGLDYIRRLYPGADSDRRVESDRALLVQLDEVIGTAQVFNRDVEVRTGPAGAYHLRENALPSAALREAIVNGAIHCDWFSPHATFIEHTGDVLTVTSPGGFVGGVGPENVITHPPRPRYRSLAVAMSDIGLGERQGVGVDRMIADMLAVGLARPVFSEIEGPLVRVSLFGGSPDAAITTFLGLLQPPEIARNHEFLMMLELIRAQGWIDATTAAPVLQRQVSDMPQRLDMLNQARLPGSSLVAPVKGIPVGSPPAYRLSKRSKSMLGSRMVHFDGPEARHDLAIRWAEARGRISSTELADLTDTNPATATRTLQECEDDGLLVPSRSNRRGRGFHYLPAGHT